MPFPPVLKFYSKKYGMWMYRQCVKPISSAIVGDFNRDIQRAVLDGLESTYYQAYDNEEYEDVGTNEHLEELPMDLTLEEMTKSNESAITTHHKSVEYQEAKAEEPQKDNDPVAEEVHQKMNVVQTLVYGINKTVDTARAFLKGLGL